MYNMRTLLPVAQPVFACARLTHLILTTSYDALLWPENVETEMQRLRNFLRVTQPASGRAGFGSSLISETMLSLSSHTASLPHTS